MFNYNGDSMSDVLDFDGYVELKLKMFSAISTLSLTFSTQYKSDRKAVWLKTGRYSSNFLVCKTFWYVN